MSENELFRTALAKAMAQCARRECCINDVRTKLDTWGLGDSESKKIINLMIRENFINEERFARSFVKDKINYNKWGKLKIAAHLKAKRVPGDIIQKALDSIDNEHYTKTLNVLLSKHRLSVKATDQFDLKAKLLRFGLSRGFESTLLYDLLNDFED